MNVERLEKVAAFLETYEPDEYKESFDMGVWKCGTSACAIGSAIAHGVTPGLTLEAAPGLTYSPVLVLNDQKSHVSWSAVRHYFGLLYKDADWLFASHSYKTEEQTPKNVAERIRKFIASKSSS